MKSSVLSPKSLREFQHEIKSRMMKFTDENLFSSSSYTLWLKTHLINMSGIFQRKPVELKTFYDPDSRISARTKGNEIEFNTGFNQSDGNRLRKMYCDLGMLVHEQLHLIFSDFMILHEIKPLLTDNMELEREFHSIRSETNHRDEILLNLKRSFCFREYYFMLWKNVCNILEDAYIESKGYKYLSGIYVISMKMMRNRIRRINQDMDLNQDICINVLNHFMLYAFDSSGSVSEDDLLNRITAECDPYIQDYINSNPDPRQHNRKMHDVYQILDILYPYMMKKEDEDTDTYEKERQPEREFSDSADEADALNQMKEYLERLQESMNELPEENPLEARRIAREQKKRNPLFNTESDSGQENPDSSASEYYVTELEKSAAEEQIAEEESERQIHDLIEQGSHLRNRIADQDHPDWKYQINRMRVNEITDAHKKKYEEIYQEVHKTADAAVKVLNHALRVREPESQQRGFYSGTRFQPCDLTRRNGRYFSRTIEPDGTPDAAFCILTDGSGSMEGNKIYEARKNAILLEDILRRTGVPLMVCEHTYFYPDHACRLNIYVDFDTKDCYDRYRLTEMSACAGNMDSGAIAYCCERLLTRPEQKKVLIVISDGEPTECGVFHDFNPFDDAVAVVKKYSKKNITIIGAVIDEGYEQIKSIYNNHCLDIRDLSLVSKELSRIVSKYILS